MWAAQIEIILLVTGLATCGALAMFLMPAMMMKMAFGRAPADSLCLLIVRHWGLLVCLVGVLLIYAAYHAESRFPILLIATLEKAAFAIGVFMSSLRRHPTAVVMALADTGMATIYLMYLPGL